MGPRGPALMRWGRLPFPADGNLRPLPPAGSEGKGHNGHSLRGTLPTVADAPQWILYVDMDAFYVNCELRRRPELRDRPVIVGHRPSTGPTRSVVLSASYEARAFGVHSAQPVGEAIRRCPDADWVPPDFLLYETVSQEVLRWLERRFALVTPHSIDEASVSISASNLEGADRTAREAQAQLHHELGLPSSWGVATSRLIAKIASDRAKPHGIVAVDPQGVAEFLAPLTVRAIPGVGPKTAATLRAIGIERIGDLAHRRASELREHLGPWATSLVAIARGHPPPDAEEPAGPRSRSTDRTFDVDRSDRAEIESEAERMARELADALAREGLGYSGVGVAVRWSDLDRTQRGRVLPGATTGPENLVVQSRRLLRELLHEERAGRDRAVRTLTIRAERVGPARAKQAVLDRY